MKKQANWRLITPLSFLLFVGSLFILDNQTLILAIALSVTLHEMAHGAMLFAYKLHFNAIFLPFLGAAILPSDTEALMRLPKFNFSLVALAGPLANITLLILGLMIVSSDNVFLGNLGSNLIQINTMLLIVNIGPIGPLDGYKIVNSIAQSIDNQAAKIAFASYSFVVGFSALLYFLSRENPGDKTSIIMSLILAAMSILLTFSKSKRDSLSKPMSKPEIAFLIIIFVIISALNIQWLTQII